MDLSDLEKAWLLYKYGMDRQWGSPGSSAAKEKDLPTLISLQNKGLVETKDDISKPYPGFILTNDGTKEASYLYEKSNSVELIKLGRLIVPPENAKVPLPKSSIFMSKINKNSN
jgi:hypothetical protein